MFYEGKLYLICIKDLENDLQIMHDYLTMLEKR